MAFDIGMSYEEYWYGEPSLFSYYMERHIRKQKEEVTETDTNAWLIGRYVLNAVNVALDSKHKRKYPEKPYTILNDPKYKQKKLEAGYDALKLQIMASGNVQEGNTIKLRTSTTN